MVIVYLYNFDTNIGTYRGMEIGVAAWWESKGKHENNSSTCLYCVQ